MVGMEAETVSDTVAEIHRWREELSSLPPAATEAEAIDRITALEELNSTSAAIQAREALTLDMLRRNRESVDGVPSKNQGRGLGAEVALARRVSRARGSALLGFSRTLIMDMPNTFGALKSGTISEEKARIVVKETTWLPREKRQEVDERMRERLAEVGIRRLGNEVRALAQKLDQKAAVDHLERRTEERTVTVRPAPGNMAYLTALLPMPQAVAAYANLSRSAQSLIGSGQSEGNSQSQLMADLLVQRLTGQESAEAIPTEVHVVMNESSLFAPGEEPAWFPGFGPIPAESARNFVAANEAEVFLRRLYTRPTDGQLVRMDSRRREFTGLLRRMVIIRDDVCRSPWCEAQIKHADHVDSFAGGGETGWDNASGLCAACNYAKELTGWRHEATADRLVVTTPTGHKYGAGTHAIAPPDPKYVEGEVVDEFVVESSTGPSGPESTGPPEPGAAGAPESEPLGPPGTETHGPPGPETAGPKDSDVPDQRDSEAIPRWLTIPRFGRKQSSTVKILGRTIGVDMWFREELRPRSDGGPSRDERPSSDNRPSPAERLLTRRLQEAGHRE